ncbi:HAMP domain-containing sensor histidine kinase [uncultured Draconibacterium sp.]|uniref:sensor histidine kinase n=1 Tax=uncultured Draconibacterium sp. TaxID=1573823 RepID=UPI0025FA8EA1|nr:HAMP domain-containing sensor histidine kinase [uncultured Draconibacterium sp.]
MKLINHTLSFLSAILFVTISLWSVLFYSQLLNHVKTSVDEGLSDYKIVIIDNLKKDTLIVENQEFGKNKYIVKQVEEDYALKVIDTYKDTLIYSPLKQNNYKARVLSTAFVANNGKYYEMKVLSQELNRSKLIKKLLVSLTSMFLFLLVSTYLVNTLALNKTWKPFYQVLDYLNDFRLDKRLSDRKMGATKIKEFVLLNKSVNNLIDTNIKIFESQKHFIENVSHEMQTPLAIGLNKLELLAENEGLTEKQLKSIGDIIDTFKRLSGLNKSLLLLSKIQNKQFLSKEKIDFDSVFTRTIANLSEFIDFWGIQLNYNKEQNFVFEMNKDMADILVLNLVKNAMIHNNPNGEISIRLTSSAFIIENTGNEGAIPSDRIFQRFNKNVNNKNSTGLGLAIVKAITDASDLRVSYSHKSRHIFAIEKPHA